MWLFNSHKKLSKINIRSSWSRFEHCSESLIYPLGSHTCSLFAPFHMESLPKVKLGSHLCASLRVYLLLFCPQYTILVQIKPSAPCVQNFKTIRKLDDSVFLRTQSYITKICYFEYLWSFEFWLAPHRDFFQKIDLFTPIHIQSWPKSKLGQV